VRPTVLVDARNVLRSRWPNLAEDEVVRASAAWASGEDVDAVVVFDGGAPTVETPLRVVGTGRESADDWITAEAARLEAADEPYWLVTSDRELRERAGGAAERVIGGGAFVGLITSRGA
jgi:hypothetical protein